MRSKKKRTPCIGGHGNYLDPQMINTIIHQPGLELAERVQSFWNLNKHATKQDTYDYK